MTASDFKLGDKVLYIPHHAHGDQTHQDCERGVVSSANDAYVFVRYFRKDGSLTMSAQATDPRDLVFRDRSPSGFYYDKPDGRPDMHTSTQDGDLDTFGRPLRPGS